MTPFYCTLISFGKLRYLHRTTLYGRANMINDLNWRTFINFFFCFWFMICRNKTKPKTKTTIQHCCKRKHAPSPSLSHVLGCIYDEAIMSNFTYILFLLSIRWRFEYAMNVFFQLHSIDPIELEFKMKFNKVKLSENSNCICSCRTTATSTRSSHTQIHSLIARL